MAGTNSPGYPGVIAGRNTTTEKPDDIGMDDDSRALFTALWAWNTGNLEWEKVDLESMKTEILSELSELTKQLKIMNFHLSILTNHEINDQEID